MINFLTRIICCLLLAMTIIIPTAVVSLLLWDIYYVDEAIKIVYKVFNRNEYE